MTLFLVLLLVILLLFPLPLVAQPKEKNMTRFEYETFELADYQVPSIRYRKICEDLNEGPFAQFGMIEPELEAFLPALKKEMEEQYDKEALVVTEEDEREYWIRLVGRKLAIELVVNNKATSKTMNMLASLPDDDFSRAVALSQIMAKELDAKVKASEATASNIL